MKIAFTGHRDKIVEYKAFDTVPKDAIWVHGGAIGFDSQVELYAKRNNITTQVILPDYKRFGRKAPLIRNHDIIKDADLLVTNYDGRLYGGTYYTVKLAKSLNIPILNIGGTE